MEYRTWLYNLGWEGSKRDSIQTILQKKMFKNVFLCDELGSGWGLLRWDRWTEREDYNLGKLLKNKTSEGPKQWEPIVFFFNPKGIGSRSNIYAVGFIFHIHYEFGKVWKLSAFLDLSIQNELIQQKISFLNIQNIWNSTYRKFNVGSMYELPDGSVFTNAWNPEQKRKELDSFFNNSCIDKDSVYSRFKSNVDLEKKPENEENGEEVSEKKNAQVQRTMRDTKIVRELKELYNFKCQICGAYLPTSETEGYCEVHHLQPLGSPHDGADKKDNMLVLCPNCHALFDLSVIAIHPDDQSVLYLFEENGSVSLSEEEEDISFSRFHILHSIKHRISKRSLRYAWNLLLQKFDEMNQGSELG